MSGSAARGTSHPAPGEDAGFGALPGAGEEGQEEGQGAKSGPRRKGASDMTSEDNDNRSSATEDNDDEEEESSSPPEGGRKKRAASTNLEAEASKRGKSSLADNSAWDVDSSPEPRRRNKPPATS